MNRFKWLASNRNIIWKGCHRQCTIEGSKTRSRTQFRYKCFCADRCSAFREWLEWMASLVTTTTTTIAPAILFPFAEQKSYKIRKNTRRRFCFAEIWTDKMSLIFIMCIVERMCSLLKSVSLLYWTMNAVLYVSYLLFLPLRNHSHAF